MINEIILIVRRRFFIEIRRWTEKYARFFLKRRPALWRNLTEYKKKSGSTGCNMTDYYVLYRRIRKEKPAEVLECGTGVSTLIIAHALMENEKENGVFGRVTSMEEVDKWGEMAKDLLPDDYRNRVEIIVSPTVEDYFSMFRGNRYRDVPNKDYDFVFVDGPKYQSPHDHHPTFDFDFIHILRNSDKKVTGLIDQRVSTVFVLQQLLGKDKIKYMPALGLACIKSCSKKDLEQLSQKLTSANFVPSFRAFRKTRLFINPLR